MSIVGRRVSFIRTTNR